MKRFFALLLAGSITVLAGCSSGDSSSSGQDTAAAGVAVQVEEVRVESIATENRVSGKVSADNSVNVIVAVNAKCTAVYKQAGDTVLAGDKICTLDLEGTLASYNAAKINYQSLVQQYNDQKAILDKQIKMAEDNVNNLKALFEIGAASQLEIDSAELQLAQAKAGRDSGLAQLEAGMQSGKSSLEQLDMVLEYVDGQGNVVAPIDGTLTTLTATEGGYVTSSMPVAVIDGAGQMKVTVMVSEALVPRLNIGDQADIAIPSANAVFEGTIRAVEKAANMQTSLYTVTLTIPAEATGILSGMFADVTFHTDRAEQAVVVPTEAIITTSGKKLVYVVEGDITREVEVTTGLAGSGVTQITSGLKGGEKLVTVGHTYLSDGDAVRVVSGEG